MSSTEENSCWQTSLSSGVYGTFPYITCEKNFTHILLHDLAEAPNANLLKVTHHHHSDFLFHRVRMLLGLGLRKLGEEVLVEFGFGVKKLISFGQSISIDDALAILGIRRQGPCKLDYACFDDFWVR